MLYKRIGLIALMLLGMIGVVEVIAYSGEALIFPPNITIQNPSNNSIYTYTTTSINLNWTSNESLIEANYELNKINYTLSTSSLCSQESANISSSCGGLNSGQYGCDASADECSLMSDGDWSTSGSLILPSNFRQFYVNYTTPVRYNGTAIWNVRCKKVREHNLTLNIPSDCIFSGKAVLRVQQGSNAYAECYNNTLGGFLTLGSCDSGNGDADPRLFEENITWGVYLESNLSISPQKGRYNISIYGNSTSNNQGQSSYVYFRINNQPNATNVSITPLPITQGNTLTGHCLYSDSDNDQAGGNQTYWYSNNSIITTANNSFTLLGGNTSEFSNITFSCRYNDTYDWSDWVNSSQATVGDSTTPVLSNWTLQYTNLNDASGNTNTFNVTVTDLSNIQTISFDLNGSINVSRSFTFTPASSITSSYSIFSSQETLLTGTYNITRLTIADSSGNIANFFINTSFTVSAQPSSGGTSGGGGGGGGSTIIQVINNTNASISNCNYNKLCEAKNGEDPFACPTDCKINTNYITCDDPTQKCIFDLFDTKNKTVRFFTVIAIAAAIIFFSPRESWLGRTFRKRRK